MAELIAVIVPREIVNDDVVRLVEWLVSDGQFVKKTQLLATLETSKATMEIESPSDGFIRFAHVSGDEVSVGGIIGHVSPDERSSRTNGCSVDIASASTEPQVARAAMPRDRKEEHPGELNGATPPRFSQGAKRLIEQQKVDLAIFAGRGLVRERDVRDALAGERRPQPPVPHSQPPVPHSQPASQSRPAAVAPRLPVRVEPLSRQKQAEGANLGFSYFSALTSSVTVACEARGLRQAISCERGLRGNLTALVLFEVSRLLRQFPIFNAFFREECVNYYEPINIGFAVDAGYGLKVLVVRDASAKSAPAIAQEMHELVGQYMDQALPLQAVSDGTFTITDLSGEGVHSFHPLLNRDQAAILGIGGEQAWGPAQGAFHLTLAFDHRLAEGRTAARFLNALKMRLDAYSSAFATTINRPSSGARADARCQRCQRGADDLKQLNGYLIHSEFPAGYVCSVCLSGF